MKHYRTLKAKYLSPTNHKGSRIKITDEYFGQSIILPYSYEFGNTEEQVYYFLIENNFNVIGYGTCNKDYIFMCNNWETSSEKAIMLNDLKK